MSVEVRKARYNPAAQLRKEITGAVRQVMKLIKRSAKAFEGSSLHKRSGKSARTISTRVRASKTSKAIRASISGAGWINVWEHGRKAYSVKPKNRKALKTPRGPRMSAGFKASGPRKVLEPAIKLHQKDGERFVQDWMERIAIEGITRTIKVKTKGGSAYRPSQL